MQQTGWAAYDCDCPVVAIAGEVSVSTAPDVLAGFRGVCGARRRIVVDLTGVTFIDSVGLGVLIEAQRCPRSAGGWLRLVCVDPEVLKVLHLTDLDDVLRSMKRSSKPARRPEASGAVGGTWRRRPTASLGGTSMGAALTPWA
jgi:anti-anti-sigma factor